MSNVGSPFHSLSNQELREQYLAAGFAGRVEWGRRPAVLVIDMAGAWTTPGEQLGSDLGASSGRLRASWMSLGNGAMFPSTSRPWPTIPI